MGLYPRKTRTIEIDLPAGPYGNVYYVDAVYGSDGHDGLRPEKPFLTIEAAYAACTAGQHDTVVLISGTSGFTLTGALTWAKDYTHLVGMCAPVREGKRARIFAPAAGAQPVLMTISATGCIFKDFYIFNGSADALALGNVLVTGERNYFENVHFAGSGHATNCIDGSYSLGLDGGGESLFKDCTFGLTSIEQPTGVRLVALIGGYPPRVRFEDCFFGMHASAATALIVEGEDGACFIEYMMFKDCYFFNESDQAMADAFLFAAIDTTRQHVILHNCWHNPGIATWENPSSGAIWVSGAPDMGTASSMGLAVVATV